MFLAHQEKLELMADLDHQGPQGPLVSAEHQVCQAPQDYLDSQELKVTLDPEVSKDPWERKVVEVKVVVQGKEVYLVLGDLQERLEVLVLMEKMVQGVNLVKMVFQDHLVLLEVEEYLVVKVQQEQKETVAPLAVLVILVLMVHLEIREKQVSLVIKGPLDLVGVKEIVENLENKVPEEVLD